MPSPTDGLSWEKPELDLIPFRGSTANNIVAPPLERQSQQGATVFRDERAAPAERYKLWTKFQPTDREVAAGVEPGLWAMHSADGIHWQTYPGQPNPPDTMCDTQNMLFWDDRLGAVRGLYPCARDPGLRRGRHDGRRVERRRARGATVP